VIVSGVGEPFFSERTASLRTAGFGSSFASECSSGRDPFTSPGWSRDRSSRESRADPRHAGLVSSSPPSQKLRLLVEAQLSDRPVGDGALLVVLTPRGGLEVVVDLAAEIGERALVLGLPRTRDGFLERQTDSSDRAPGPTYFAEGRKSRPVRFCSRMCADHPATREQANIAGASGGGISATSRTSAE
jgi:hypothetical protein